jgi:hypothetical protein
MLEFQLTRVALVGARIALFNAYGVRARNELAARSIVPANYDRPLTTMPEQALYEACCRDLPLWVHNILADPAFPQRAALLMPLRRFEGELRDSKDNAVVSAVLSAGFRDQNLDPLDLPDRMPMRQRCALVMQVGVWQEAYRRLEDELVTILTSSAAELDSWLNAANEADRALAG